MSDPTEIRLARLDERQKAVRRALKLQAREYDRRLEALNHAHEKAVQVQHTYVTSEKFEDFVEHYGKEREAIAKALTLAEGNKQGVGQLWGWIVGIVAVLTSVILVVGDVLTP